MFLCDYCQKPIGPKVSPILVHDPAEDRHVDYLNTHEDEDGIKQEVLTHGREITAEYKQCHECAGVKAPAENPINFALWNVRVDSLHLHAKRCKAPLMDCKQCQKALSLYAEIPALALSVALSR